MPSEKAVEELEDVPQGGFFLLHGDARALEGVAGRVGVGRQLGRGNRDFSRRRYLGRLENFFPRRVAVQDARQAAQHLVPFRDGFGIGLFRVKAIGDELQNRRVIQRRMVGRSGFDIRRSHKRGHPSAGVGEGFIMLPLRRLCSHRQGLRMIEASARLIVGDDEHGFFPARRV